MKRALALLVCMASAGLIYGTSMELFIAWYCGTEIALELLGWIILGVQVIVNLVAAALAWRIVRQPGVDRSAVELDCSVDGEEI